MKYRDDNKIFWGLKKKRKLLAAFVEKGEKVRKRESERERERERDLKD